MKREISLTVFLGEGNTVQLPEIMTQALGWLPGAAIEAQLGEGEDGHIMLYTAINRCQYCGDIEGPFYQYRDNVICGDCQQEISDLRPTVAKITEENREQQKAYTQK